MKGKSPGNMLQLTGERFGKLTAIARVSNDAFGRAVWRCLCDCGREADVAGFRLKRGHTRSCGCLMRQGNVTHGKSRTPTHNSWIAMKARCFNPAYKFFSRYGGRGISVCDRWNDSFEAFLEDMGERPAGATLDRIDVDGNYCPENCRWATIAEQQNNRATTIMVTREGRTMSVSQWCAELGISRDRVYKAIRHGVPPAEALER